MSAQSDYAKRRYHEKKAAGICVQSGCHVMPETSVLCPEHSKKRNDRTAVYKGRPDVLKRYWQKQKRRHQERVEMGLCIHCNQPLVRSKYCARHYEQHHALQERYWRRKGAKPSQRKCGNCGTVGKRKDYCECRFKGARTIEELALGRNAA